MKPAWAIDFPRLYELYIDSDITSPTNYFADFEDVLQNPTARPHYERLEEDLQKLDDNAWRELKRKAAKYVTIRDKHRAYEQLFNTLSEVKGYLYLISEGCVEVCFIPEVNIQTPDLYGLCGSAGILMEVKTINTSSDELDWIRANSELRNGRMTARRVRNGLGNSLRNKLVDTINTAKEQLMSYSCNGVQRKIVYLITKPDLGLALNSENIGELIAFIEEQGNNQVEVRHCFRGWQTSKGESQRGEAPPPSPPPLL